MVGADFSLTQSFIPSPQATKLTLITALGRKERAAGVSTFGTPVLNVLLKIAVVAVVLGNLGTRSAEATLNVSFQFNGRGNWSLDGVGSNNTPVGTINAMVPPGSIVVKAFLYSTLFNDFGTPTAPTVVMDGVTYGPTGFVSLGALSGLCCPTTLQLQAFRADATTQVAAKIGGGSASQFSFSIDSENPNENVDGEALAIIYSNPAEQERTIAFLDGSSSATGDTTTFNFVSPVDTTSPGFEALMSLAIGFSFQPGEQVSIVDGNGRRLSSSAGGQDDGGGFNGGLITVGGIGDSPANPDPFAGSSSVRTDDELYNLALGNSADATPFLTNGATSFTVITTNPSLNDNIFFLGLNVTARGAVTTGLALSPLDATNTVGQVHTVTATTTTNNLPVSNVAVNVSVTGANSASGTCVTGPDGTCTFSYTGLNAGDDTITASGTIAGQQKTATANKTWILAAQPTPTSTPSQTGTVTPTCTTTETPTQTLTPTNTGTATPTTTATQTQTAIPTETPTAPSATTTATPTETPTVTPTVAPPLPQLGVQPPEPHDFGPTLVGYHRAFTYTITNTGGGTLIGAVTAPCDGFSVAPPDFSLGGGQQTSVVVTFTPGISGPLSCQLNITSNGGSIQLALNGSGIPPAPIPVVPSPASPAGLAMIALLALSIGWVLRSRGLFTRQHGLRAL